MTQETVSQIISKALSDAPFREQLFADPAKALAGYDLTEEERTSLSGLKPEELQTFANDLESRISKSGLIPGRGNLNPQPEPPLLRR
jgi:hypothetical protein